MTKTRTVRAGTADIAAAMRKRYPSQAYATLFEVGNATGHACTRHADALVMSLWPSRGLEVLGFEFKSSRSDWIKERDDPAKAEAVMQYCDRWYLAVSDEAVIKPGELPPTWGFVTLSGGTLVTRVEAPLLNAKPWPREFLAAVMRCISDPVAAIDNTAISTAREQGRAEEAKRSNFVLKEMQDKYVALQNEVRNFETHTGVSITGNRWTGLSAKEVSHALKSLADGSCRHHLENLEHMSRTAESLKCNVDSALAGIRKLLGGAT